MSKHLKGAKNSLYHELFMLLRWKVLFSRACIKITRYKLIIWENFGSGIILCWIFCAPSVINMCSANDKELYFQVVLKEEPSLCDDTESTNELLQSTGNGNQENVNTGAVHCIHK
jgi:hypothetical protein